MKIANYKHSSYFIEVCKLRAVARQLTSFKFTNCKQEHMQHLAASQAKPECVGGTKQATQNRGIAHAASCSAAGEALVLGVVARKRETKKINIMNE